MPSASTFAAKILDGLPKVNRIYRKVKFSSSADLTVALATPSTETGSNLRPRPKSGCIVAACTKTFSATYLGALYLAYNNS